MGQLEWFLRRHYNRLHRRILGAQSKHVVEVWLAQENTAIEALVENGLEDRAKGKDVSGRDGLFDWYQAKRETLEWVLGREATEWEPPLALYERAAIEQANESEDKQ